MLRCFFKCTQLKLGEFRVELDFKFLKLTISKEILQFKYEIFFLHDSVRTSSFLRVDPTEGNFDLSWWFLSFRIEQFMKIFQLKISIGSNVDHIII